VPVAVKDLVFTGGLRTTFGSRLYADFVPDDDDIAVARLRAAGAIIIGKTNAAEFGYGGVGHNPLFPTTRNPWDTTLTPGGSSAGSAAAVAAGVCPLAVGSDGGGSVRLPAAFTGIVGIKASMGRVPLWPGCRDPRFPGASGWESIEHIGPLARSVADAALMLSVMSGPDERDRWSLPDDGLDWRSAARPRERLGLRIAYCQNWGALPVDGEVGTIVMAAVSVFTDADCVVDEIADPLGDVIDCYRTIVALETDIPGLARLAAGRKRELSPAVAALLDTVPDGRAAMTALVQRKHIAETLAGLMSRYDLLLTPTVPVAAFALDRNGPGMIDGRPVADDAWTPALFPFNLTGHPAASVPAGWTASGLPVGLQIVGRHLADADVVTAAATFEAMRPWRHRRPEVS
jgi:aspartyl-tRNA(Asn)/glutamyl-tRNA(Gln) amidotransferase subunit A